MITLALRIKVRATLAAAHRQASKRVLKRLLKSEEFEHAFGDTRVKADAAFIGPDGVVVLHPPATVNPNIVIVILPADTKRNDAIRLSDPAQNLIFMVLFLICNKIENIFRCLLHSLHKLRLARVALFYAFNELG